MNNSGIHRLDCSVISLQGVMTNILTGTNDCERITGHAYIIHFWCLSRWVTVLGQLALRRCGGAKAHLESDHTIFFERVIRWPPD